MSDRSERAVTLEQSPPARCWQVRAATHEDVAQVAAAVRELLVELGGSPPAPLATEEATRALLEDPDGATVLVADAKGVLVGVLAVSWQAAIHVPGVYALIQDLWVHSSWRGGKVGSALLGALFELARERRVARVEVGLPQEHFAGIRATESFYRASGFTPLGPRMRCVLE
jgi:GNAT superfamily N-acetyltransferase